MKNRSRFQTRSGLLGVAGFTMAGLVAACEQAAPTNNVVQKSEDGACVITRIADARAATHDNMEAKPKEAAMDACNPCGGCNPCAAACNPCAAACSPCAATCNPCGGCNPCAAACNPCAGSNPCAAACNPCAAACNPCAAACNPCAATCNPCGGCNPCAAACNPCAGSNPCGGCNPCAGMAEPVEASAEELTAAYNCLKAEMKVSYGMAGENGADTYQDWEIYNTEPYPSATHGGHMVNNYANSIAEAYGRFEDAGPMPVGAIAAKDSLTIDANGKAVPGPLFLMEKMEAGFDPDYGDWKYSLIMPDGSTWGVTGGKNSNGMKFCSDCHVAVEDFDYLFFLPDAYRKE